MKVQHPNTSEQELTISAVEFKSSNKAVPDQVSLDQLSKDLLGDKRAYFSNQLCNHLRLYNYWDLPMSEMQSQAGKTAQKMRFLIKDFLSKCDQIRNFLQIWSHLLRKSLMENFIFCAVQR